jgi:hypothetical protein
LWDFYDRRMSELHRDLVPPAGEAATKQGEIVRCVCNLYDEGFRNGFGNWDDEDEESVSYLLQHLRDPTTFDSRTVRAIGHALERVRLAGPSIEAQVPFEDLKFLLCRTVDWCELHADPIPLQDDDEYVGHD